MNSFQSGLPVGADCRLLEWLYITAALDILVIIHYALRENFLCAFIPLLRVSLHIFVGSEFLPVLPCCVRCDHVVYAVS